jgi:hypothetical protein
MRLEVALAEPQLRHGPGALPWRLCVSMHSGDPVEPRSSNFVEIVVLRGWTMIVTLGSALVFRKSLDPVTFQQWTERNLDLQAFSQSTKSGFNARLRWLL